MTAVYGGRGRIGLIVPANNSVIEPELWSALPEGYAAHATRILARGELTAEAVRRMEREADAALEAIAATRVDVIAYCDMVTTFIMEPGWNEAAVERFSRLAGVPCLSAWTALRDALQSLGVRRMALGTPYPRAIHALAPPFFAQRGYDVATHATLDILAMHDVPQVDGERLRAFVARMDVGGCDALVLLATDLPTFACIEPLEQALGVPVVSSNQAILWAALRALGAPRPARAPGRLFRR